MASSTKIASSTRMELTITTKDWVIVLIIASVFSTLLSIFEYKILDLDWIEGLYFGAVLGLLISLFSFFLISLANNHLLPKITKKIWNLTAALCSFLSGFLATITTLQVATFLKIQIIQFLEMHPYKGSALVGFLTYLIGNLIYRFVKTRNEKEHLDNLLIQSRLKSLETQLNPHFIFNALNSLAQLVHQDPTKAEDVIIRLSHFLRNTMQESALVALSDEIDNVHSYVELEKIRFQGLSLIMNVDRNLHNIPVPKFSIQLIVENAIKHGFSKLNNTLTIKIDTKKDGDMVTILVSNDGKEISDSSFGIGLSNLEERLVHLCSGQLRLICTKPITYSISMKVCR